MTDQLSQLPWEDLRRVEGDLPWSALESFADAVVAAPDVAAELFAEYDKAWQAVDTPTYIDLYVPAIFTLAAPKLSDEQRQEIGGFLVDRLIQAGREDAETAEETLVKAAGSMGPVILPKVLDTLNSTPEEAEEAEAWAMCWSLTALAAKTDDAAIRDRTIHTCLRLLEQIDRGEREEFLGISAGWTLVYLNYADAAPLLERLSRKVAPIDGGADFREASRLLQKQSAHVHPQIWEVPVKEWLPSSWKSAKEWYAQQNAQDSEGEEEAAFQKRAGELVDRFLASPGAAELPGDATTDAPFLLRSLLEYARTYEGENPEELTQRGLRSVLLEVFPRKMTAQREFFEQVPPVVGAFLRWMASEGIVAEGESLAAAVQDWTDDIVTAAMDSRNWGPAKKLAMELQRKGIDVRDQEAVFSRMFEGAQQGLDEIPQVLPEQTPIAPSIPIVEHAPKVGRNDPCPCSSGKKYKKCHGAPTQE